MACSSKLLSNQRYQKQSLTRVIKTHELDQRSEITPKQDVSKKKPKQWAGLGCVSMGEYLSNMQETLNPIQFPVLGVKASKSHVNHSYIKVYYLKCKFAPPPSLQ